MSEKGSSAGFFSAKFKYDEIPELEKDKRGKEKPIAISKISIVLDNIGAKISSIMKNTALEPDRRISDIDKSIVGLFEQLQKYCQLAGTNKIRKIKRSEEIPLFKKLGQAIVVYDNHEGNIKEALKILTEIQANKSGCVVLMQKKIVNSKGEWSSELSEALKDLYEDYSNISMKKLNNEIRDEKKQNQDTTQKNN